MLVSRFQKTTSVLQFDSGRQASFKTFNTRMAGPLPNWQHLPGPDRHPANLSQFAEFPPATEQSSQQAPPRSQNRYKWFFPIFSHVS
jgi:hypothetical protein